MNQDDADRLITAYARLRAKCYNLARFNNGERMGDSAWLRYALSESEIDLEPRANGIGCWGYTFTCQTQSSEHFDFEISYADIDNFHELQRLEWERLECAEQPVKLWERPVQP